jgi:alginate O-acetyltransferase complex protein AlgI
MALSDIALFALIAFCIPLLIPGRWRAWAMCAVSIVAIFWLQPPLPVRWLDFVLSAVTLGLVIIVWRLTQSSPKQSMPEKPSRLWQRQDYAALVLAIVVTAVLALARDVPFIQSWQITTRPPELRSVLIGIGLFLVLLIGPTALAYLRGNTNHATPRLGQWIAIIGIIILLVILKTEPFVASVAAGWRTLSGQDVSLASVVDVRWLGFSYVAFRLIHMLRDAQLGTLPALSLRDTITYVLFFPAYTAGPIDRAERFLKDVEKWPSLPRWDANRVERGLLRIASGLFRKFVLADLLSLVALNPAHALQVQSAPTLWLMLYAYAFYLYFDFSGYTDVAIGIGILTGVTLPENFDRPYTKHNIALFWQSWHRTLSDWVRFYVYSPLSRALLKRKPKPPTDLVIAICNLATMLIIGLWHGVTGAFIVWGIWHAVALFVHKMWSDRTRKWYMRLKAQPERLRLWNYAGIFITFHVVVLAWVWFALPDAGMAIRVLGRLFGVGW